MLHPGPLPRNADWLDWVNRPQSEAELIDLSRIDQRDESQPDFGRIAEIDHGPETTEKKDDDSTSAPPQ
jgi:hypothetical protein